MIRTLYPHPAEGLDLGVLLGELRSVDPTVVATNTVGDEVAVYAPGVVDEQALGAVVAAHAPPAFPPLDALGRMATLSAVLHDDVGDWANASGIPAAHLVHEALAWSLGG
jgi:hypothetical protein